MPAHAQTSAPVAAIPQCTNLVMRQVSGDSQDTNLTVSATGQFPSEFAGQVFNITFDAYKEVVVTQAQDPEQGVLVAAADLFSPSIAYATAPACTVTVPATVAGDGTVTAETTLTCGPSYKQVVGIIRTGETGGEECCRGVLDVAGCNPCSSSTASSGSSTGPVCGDGKLDVFHTNNSTVDVTITDALGTSVLAPGANLQRAVPANNINIDWTPLVGNIRLEIYGIQCDGMKVLLWDPSCSAGIGFGTVPSNEATYKNYVVDIYNNTC